jgi:MoaA/NifB/PqqE/SkfB family radical SAM enzyme
MIKRTKAGWRELAEANERLNLQEMAEGKIELTSRPTWFNIDLIGVCNMRPPCGMCRYGEVKLHAHPGLDFDEFANYGEFLDTASIVLNCSFGEPLLHPRLLDFIKYLHDRDKQFGMTSNGLALSKAMVERLLPYADTVNYQVSLDAATPETYRKIRSGNFEKICRKIAYFCQRRRELGRELRATVNLCMLPMRCNRHEVRDFVRLGAELGVDRVELRELDGFHGNKVVERNGYIFDYAAELLTKNELEACRLEAEEAGREFGIRVITQFLVTEDEYFYLFKPKELQHLPMPCTMPWYLMVAYNDGGVIPCCYFGSSIGNWREQSWEEIWNGEAWQNMRRQLAAGELADLCRLNPYCPLVERFPQFKRRERLLALLPDGGGPEGLRLSADDSRFADLLEAGFFDLETDAGDGRTYRWMAEEATFLLPLTSARGRLELTVRSDKPNFATDPLQLSFYLGGTAVGSTVLENQDITTVPISCPAQHDQRFMSLEVRCANPWRPNDYFGTSDHRLLSARLYGVTFVAD